MNQWAFVIAAYAVAWGGTGALLLWAWRTMRRAESSLGAIREQDRDAA